MKTQSNVIPQLVGEYSTTLSQGGISRKGRIKQTSLSAFTRNSKLRQPLFTCEAARQMAFGNIPDEIGKDHKRITDKLLQHQGMLICKLNPIS